MARDYYVILGVDPDASPDQIKSAYRRKAKQLHPDHYEGGSKPFRDVQEAYEALSDPERRECYDAEQAHARRARVTPWRTRPEPLRATDCPVEPLIPDEPSGGWGQAPLGRSRFTSYSEPLDRLWDELEGWSGPAGRRREAGQVVIPLTHAQAQRGGRVRVWVAVRATCPNCGGVGRVGFHGCWECFGEGTIVEQHPVWIVFPAGVSDRAVATVSLAPLGAPDADLTVRFRVRG